MEQFLSKYPKLLIAVVVLGIATFFIIYSNPMHTVCDVQVEGLKGGMTGTMYAGQIQGKRVPPRFSEAKKNCQTGASSGACSEYFEIQKQLIREIEKINTECYPQLSEIAAYKGVLKGGIEILSFAAWGSQIPADTTEKYGWLGEVDLSTFCRIKGVYRKVYGLESLNGVMNGIFKDLPGESKILDGDAAGKIQVTTAVDLLTRQKKPNIKDEIWRKSLFSLNCDIYK